MSDEKIGEFMFVAGIAVTLIGLGLWFGTGGLVTGLGVLLILVGVAHA